LELSVFDFEMKSFLNCFLLLLIAMSGCTTKSQARAQANAAYNAGRASAYQQVLEEQRVTVRVIGNVRNPEFEWTDGMSLMDAIVRADCMDRRNPKEIVIIRKHERIAVDMKAFLNGEDVLVEKGDTIEIHP
jgi:hypothetical protein